jgi:short-subunit dehydrogenase
MPGIIKATEDVDIPIIFNNAGYIVTGFFDQTTLDAQLANVECNATATVKVTYHFLKMLAKDMKGCIVFTSSLSSYIPNPFLVMYGTNNAHQFDLVEFSKRFALHPNQIPKKILSCIGRVHWGEIGLAAVFLRIVVSVVLYDFFLQIFASAVPIY